MPVLLLLLLCAAAPAQEPQAGGPVALVIQYKCLPGQRAQFRQRVVQTGLRRFAQWQSEGILSGYHILFSRYVNTRTWDMLALLTFPASSEVSGNASRFPRPPVSIPRHWLLHRVWKRTRWTWRA